MIQFLANTYLHLREIGRYSAACNFVKTGIHGLRSSDILQKYFCFYSRIIRKPDDAIFSAYTYFLQTETVRIKFVL